MIDELVKRGLEQEDANTIVTTMAKKPAFFVDFMMTEELGLEIPDDPWGPLKEGFGACRHTRASSGACARQRLVVWPPS